jgi:hypothetical protein
VKSTFRIADYPLIVRNNSALPATSVQLKLIHLPTDNSVPIEPGTEFSIQPGKEIETNLFFELDTVLHNLGVYDQIQRKILDREPISLAIECQWFVPGLNQEKRETKEITLIWQGGRYGGGLQWDTIT